jgi:hypothetical protein
LNLEWENEKKMFLTAYIALQKRFQSNPEKI